MLFLEPNYTIRTAPKNKACHKHYTKCKHSAVVSFDNNLHSKPKSITVSIDQPTPETTHVKQKPKNRNTELIPGHHGT